MTVTVHVRGLETKLSRQVEDSIQKLIDTLQSELRVSIQLSTVVETYE